MSAPVDSEQLGVEDPEDPAPTAGDPEDPAPTAGDPEDPAPTAEDPEDPAPTAEDPEDPASTHPLGSLPRLLDLMGGPLPAAGLGVAVALAGWKLGGSLLPIVVLAVLLAGYAILLRKFRLLPAVVAVALVGVGVQVGYLTDTPYDTHNFDAPAHLTYIKYLLEHHALPPDAACSICHHPPAYYLLAAVAYRIAQWANVSEPVRGVQLLSLGLWSSFTAFGLLTVARLVRRAWVQTVAAALIVLWPYAIVSSVRVNNDVLVAVAAAACIFFAIRWIETGERRWPWFAAIATIIGLLTKASALPLIAVLVVALALRVIWLGGWRAQLRTGLPVLLLLIAIPATQLVVRARRGGDLESRLIGNAQHAWDAELAQQTPRYYLTFNPQRLLGNPYAQIFIRSNEPTYWNHLIKSSVYGTEVVRKRAEGTKVPAERTARWLNALLLPLMTIVGIGLLLGVGARRRRPLIAALFAGVFIAGGLVFHLLAPKGFHADFRFVLPALIPLAVLYGHTITRAERKSRVLALLLVVPALAFVLLAAGSLLTMEKPAASYAGAMRPPRGGRSSPAPPSSATATGGAPLGPLILRKAARP